jgi:hypothetical protein
MKVLARRTVSGLVACDEQAAEEFRRVPVGVPVYVEIKAARNPKQHRLLFALLNIVTEAGEYPSTDAALLALKLATGLVESVQMDKAGTVQLIPKSISFANMRGNEFSAWFETAIQVVITRWLPGMTNEQLRKEIEDMVS